MRYGILLPSFWNGDTGRQLQQCGKDAVILAAYLTANDHANMIGLYHIPKPTILRDLPVLENGTILGEALLWLDAADYAFYDTATSFTWVCEMARFRLNLPRGEQMARDDKRRLGAVRAYEQLANNPFLGPFFDRYSAQLQLPRRRGTPPTNDAGSDGSSTSRPKGLEGASRGLKGLEAPSQSTCVRTSTRSDQVHQVRTHALTTEVLPPEGVRAQGSGARAVAAPRGYTASVVFQNDVVNVPRVNHQRFVTRLVNAGVTYAEAEAQLFAWYPVAILPFRGQPIGDRETDFWDKRFAEWLGTTVSARNGGSSIGAVAARNAEFLSRRRQRQ